MNWMRTLNIVCLSSFFIAGAEAQEAPFLLNLQNGPTEYSGDILDWPFAGVRKASSDSSGSHKKRKPRNRRRHGDTGPTGPTGPTGLPGPAGAQGATGPTQTSIGNFGSFSVIRDSASTPTVAAQTFTSGSGTGDVLFRTAPATFQATAQGVSVTTTSVTPPICMVNITNAGRYFISYEILGEYLAATTTQSWTTALRINGVDLAYTQAQAIGIASTTLRVEGIFNLPFNSIVEVRLTNNGNNTLTINRGIINVEQISQ